MNDERDPKVSAVYRELGAEEPPRALDDAILAASRRGAGARPASLDRASRQRWYAPVATAAVLMLAVAVTLHMQVEQPDVAAPVPRAEVTKEAVRDAVTPAIPPKPVESARRSEPQPFPAREQPVMAQRQAPAAPQAAAPAPAPPAVLSSRTDEARDSAAGAAVAAASSAAGSVGRAEDRAMREGEVAASAPQAAPVQAQAFAKRAAGPANAPADIPERELERIAGLRAQGRHDEADKALAEFRKRYPDFRIAEDMRVRVERR